MAYHIDAASGDFGHDIEETDACDGEGEEVDIDEDGFAVCPVCDDEWGGLWTDEKQAVIPRHKPTQTIADDDLFDAEELKLSRP